MALYRHLSGYAVKQSYNQPIRPIQLKENGHKNDNCYLYHCQSDLSKWSYTIYINILTCFDMSSDILHTYIYKSCVIQFSIGRNFCIYLEIVFDLMANIHGTHTHTRTHARAQAVARARARVRVCVLVIVNSIYNAPYVERLESNRTLGKWVSSYCRRC